MLKRKLWVRHLTLVPLSDLDVDMVDVTSCEEDDMVQLRLDRQKLSRAIEIFVAASEAGRKRSSSHGINPISFPNFGHKMQGTVPAQRQMMKTTDMFLKGTSQHQRW
jgi:hypothetical protein